MAGSLLAQEGDVQVGADTDAYYTTTPMLLRQGTSVWADNFSPWVEPEVVSNDSPISGSNELWQSLDSFTVRRVQFNVWVTATTATAMRATLGNLGRIIRPPADTQRPSQLADDHEQELAFQMLGKKYVMYGRYRGMSLPRGDLFSRRVVPVKVQFVATDPLGYDIAETSSSPATSTTIGVTPVSYPLATTFAPLTPTGSITVDHYAPPRWRLLIQGPTSGTVVNARLVNVSEGLFVGVGNGNGFGGDPAANRYNLGSGQSLQFRSWLKLVDDNQASPPVNDLTKWLTKGSTWDVFTPGGSLYTVALRNDGGAQTAPSGQVVTLYLRYGYWFPA